MIDYPEYIKVNGKTYKINTDFRIALKCEDIARDETIDNEEKILAIIYKLFGEEALYDKENYNELIEKATTFLWCGKEKEELNNDSEPSMDFKQDLGYIRASFMSDYGMNIGKEKIHWWYFNDLLQGLTEDSILNRVRNIREEPLSGKKGKELEELKKAKKLVALKRQKTSEEIELENEFEEKMKRK